MRIANYLILLTLMLVLTGWVTPTAAFAKSSIPASCSKIKQNMTRACSKRQKTCPRLTTALNQCLKKSAYRSLPKPLPAVGSICFMLQQPVCALTISGELRLFGNSCWASVDGATTVPLEQCDSK